MKSDIKAKHQQRCGQERDGEPVFGWKIIKRTFTWRKKNYSIQIFLDFLIKFASLSLLKFVIWVGISWKWIYG